MHTIPICISVYLKPWKMAHFTFLAIYKQADKYGILQGDLKQIDPFELIYLLFVKCSHNTFGHLFCKHFAIIPDYLRPNAIGDIYSTNVIIQSVDAVRCKCDAISGNLNN